MAALFAADARDVRNQRLEFPARLIEIDRSQVTAIERFQNSYEPSRLTVKVLQQPATLDRLSKAGVAPLILTPAQFDARIRAEIIANGAVAKAAGIKPN